MWCEEAFIFFPSRFPEGQWHQQAQDIRDVWFTAADGVRLHGWYLPHPAPIAVLLFAHGNAGNLSDRIWQLEQLRRVGASVLIFDYRGYGKSEGSPTERGILQDARAARRELARLVSVSESDIVLLGRSLGGAVMAQLAAERRPRGLVLESTFTSIADVAAYHFRWLPVRYLLRTRLDAASAIRSVRCPLLVSHGARDTIVPYALGQRLFELANEPKQFISLPGQDHNDPPPASYYAALRQFLLDLA